MTKASYGEDQAREYVEQSGYKNVTLKDVDTIYVGARGCSERDELKYEFTATAPNGAPDVTIDVCKGILKGATLRQG